MALRQHWLPKLIRTETFTLGLRYGSTLRILAVITDIDHLTYVAPDIGACIGRQSLRVHWLMS